MKQWNTLDLFLLRGQTALVTGGARNLGYDMASAMAEAGADVVITSRSREKAEHSAEELAAQTGSRVLGLPCDVRYENQAEHTVRAVLQTFGRLDILINNAGNVESSPENAPMEIRPLEEWERTVDVNLKGVFLCSKHAVSLAMKPANNGVIINIASVLGMVGKDRRCYENTGRGGPTVDYAAAKGGVINMTRDMACYLARYNIRVNCISPGGFYRNEGEAFARRYGRDVPLGRMGRMGHEIKGAALYLASSASSYVTGINLPVDGGLTAW